MNFLIVPTNSIDAIKSCTCLFLNKYRQVCNGLENAQEYRFGQTLFCIFLMYFQIGGVD